MLCIIPGKNEEMRKRRLGLIFGVSGLGLVLLIGPAARAKDLSGAEDYPVKVETNVAAVMRDGVRLAADIYRPDNGGKFPAILIRTPYNKEFHGRPSSFPRLAASRGYVVIVQDVRGRFSSEGEFHPYVQETNDGYDAMEWAASLPFSNGKVGTTGCSYLGAVQWQLALADPPHLVAIFPQCTYANARTFFFFGGALDLTWISWLNRRLPDLKRRKWAGSTEVSEEEAERQWAENKWNWLNYLPLKDFPLLRMFCPYYYDWLDHPDDGPFWDFANIEKGHARVSVPALNLTGWFDDGYGQPGAIGNFLGMKKNGKTKEARDGQKLIIGPWTHCDAGSSRAGELDFGREAALDVDALALRWFDFWLKGKDNGFLREPRVRIFVMGDNVWREEREWPLARARASSFYLHSRGAANSYYGDGTLSETAPHEEKSDTYVYDPANPVTDYRFEEPGVRDQRPLEVRHDVLVYTSAPLDRDLEVTGPLTAELWASSTAKDTDFMVKITDVYPGGYSQNITPPLSGILRARYRDSEMNPELLEPGKVYKLTIGLMTTSHVFHKGHRIRASVTSSFFPHIDRNPNTGHPFGKDGELERAVQTIHHDRTRPSRVILPAIPR
ncbi:MAG: CocE/NonD family hydrolase [Acidobacteriota bacterium]